MAPTDRRLQGLHEQAAELLAASIEAARLSLLHEAPQVVEVADTGRRSPAGAEVWESPVGYFTVTVSPYSCAEGPWIYVFLSDKTEANQVGKHVADAKAPADRVEHAEVAKGLIARLTAESVAKRAPGFRFTS
jgi:hypothetical protein